MANRLKNLDPQASPLALFGATVRASRREKGLSQASLGRLVHTSGALIGKIEKAERRPQPDLIALLDRALQADGNLRRLGREMSEDGEHAPPPGAVPVPSPDTAVTSLRAVIDTARSGDHAMSPSTEHGALLAHAHAAGRVIGRVGRGERKDLFGLVAEAHQLAGWISFDQGRLRKAEQLLGDARGWVERAADPLLAAYVLGPNLSFMATYGGDAALGVERAYGSVGWARRSGSRRLTGFALTIGARAHARLGEPRLCFDLLDRAEAELDAHDSEAGDGSGDPGWLSVFDRAALEGHRGSCLLDLGLHDQAVRALTAQDRSAPRRFVRNRVIWHLDRIDALLGMGEIDEACAQVVAAMDNATTVSPRVLRRFRAIELRLDELVGRPEARVDAALAGIRSLSAAYG